MELGEFKKLRSGIVSRLDEMESRLERVLGKTDDFFQAPPEPKHHYGKGLLMRTGALEHDAYEARERLEPHERVTPGLERVQRLFGITEEPETSVLGETTLEGTIEVWQDRLHDLQQRELHIYRDMMNAFERSYIAGGVACIDQRHEIGRAMLTLFNQEVGELEPRAHKEHPAPWRLGPTDPISF